MKNRFLILGVLLGLSYSLSAYAINAPYTGTIPPEINADTFTIEVFTEPGATITVAGGSAQVAPVTDGEADDPEDGMVEITVGLAQNELNVFSITAELNGSISDSVIVEIEEISPVAELASIPEAPILNPIPEFVDAVEYIITGTAQPEHNIYARTVEGDAVGSTRTDAEGDFQLTVPLEENKTNRFNVSAENDDGIEGPATQAVIRQSEELPDVPEEVTPTLTTSAQIFFNDIQGHWAEDYINTLYLQDVVSGKSEGIFAPNALITRAELTKIAILAFGHSVNTSVDEHPFQDVPLNSWYAPYIEEAKRLGIVEGYPSGGFGPNDFITRAAALKILLGAAGFDTGSSLGSADFPDVPENAWFEPYVGFAQENEVVSGYEDGTFGPGNNMTRAQVAKVVVNLLDMKKFASTETKTFKDAETGLSFAYPAYLTLDASLQNQIGFYETNVSGDREYIYYALLSNEGGLSLQDYFDEQNAACEAEAPTDPEAFYICPPTHDVSAWDTLSIGGFTAYRSDVHGIPESGEVEEAVYIMLDGQIAKIASARPGLINEEVLEIGVFDKLVSTIVVSP